jgi:hypothetical protein
MRLIASPYETVCINKHNGCCHMENVEMAKKRVIRTIELSQCLECADWNSRNTTLSLQQFKQLNDKVSE